MEDRVGDAKGLPVEEPEYNLPVALSHQTKYQAEKYRAQNNAPLGYPLQSAHYSPGPKTCLTPGC